MIINTKAIQIIYDTLMVKNEDIKNVEVLKKGMTNHSFVFECKGNKYIMRIPGEGTDKLINRKQEAEVYNTISGYNLCDNPIYISADNGYKLTRFISNVRVADPNNANDVKACMEKLRRFHELDLQVQHTFDIFEHIDFYEFLWDGKKSVYSDYEITKQHVFELKKYIEKHVEKSCLTHIDAIPDNFLFDDSIEGEMSLQLTDWEYAGMQDPHVDIAMFSIYSAYNKENIDKLIDLYFEDNCKKEIRIKIYCYIAACGLLWSNWCEYKHFLGIEFGEYSLSQYRYAKEFYKIAKEQMEK